MFIYLILFWVVSLFFNALTSIIAEFPISSFIFVIASPCKKKVEQVFVFSILQFIYQLHAEVSIEEKSIY